MVTDLNQRKPRATLRASERGMAMFMVVMVLMVVSAIGIFSARAASQVDLAVGQARHALQAQFTAEFAMRAATADIAESPETYFEILNPNGTLGERGNCKVDNTPTCVIKETEDILVQVARVTPNPPNGLIGSLNHEQVTGNGANGTFTIQLDDMVQVAETQAGNTADTIVTYDVTALTIGVVEPGGEPAGGCSNAIVAAGSQQMVRGHITFEIVRNGLQ